MRSPMDSQRHAVPRSVLVLAAVLAGSLLMLSDASRLYAALRVRAPGLWTCASRVVSDCVRCRVEVPRAHPQGKTARKVTVRVPTS